MSYFLGNVIGGSCKYRNKTYVAKRVFQSLKYALVFFKQNKMTAKTVYDVIVVGAGIEGSAIAYTLAKRGKKTLLLEQFPLPHSRGSSHGQSRITRYAYEDSFYVRMMVDAFPMWAQLEQESNKRLSVNCGLLHIQYRTSQSLQQMSHALHKYHVPHEILRSQEIRRRFPPIKVSEDCHALLDPQGGFLKADKCLRAYQDVFQHWGGVIHDEEPVLKIDPGDVVTVVTPSGQYTAHNVVIAAGPWSGKLCKSLNLEVHLQPIRALVLYWKIDENYVSHYQPANFPCFVDARTSDDHHMYGFPTHEYPGMVKICLNPDVIIDPDDRDKMENDGRMVEDVKRSVALTFQHLASSPSIREYCIYTNTPDNHPYLDTHPEFPNITIAAGFSGHGFKLAPAVGKAVSELVLKEPLTYNMEPFKLARFYPKANL